MTDSTAGRAPGQVPSAESSEGGSPDGPETGSHAGAYGSGTGAYAGSGIDSEEDRSGPRDDNGPEADADADADSGPEASTRSRSQTRAAAPSEKHPPGGRPGAHRRRGALRAAAAPLALWAATRTWLLLCVFKVVTLPGPDYTADVALIYQSWYLLLKTGEFPAEDVTWQYPPGAALSMVSPDLLPFFRYPTAFFVLACLVDAVVLVLLLRAARRPGRRLAGAWCWVAGVPLLGPTAYARYDLQVTAVAVAALLAAARSPRLAGALAGLGAMLKVWPALVLLGAERGRPTRVMWLAALLSAAVVLGGFAATMPGALAFVQFQQDRGTEVESLGALVLHVARHFGWEGQVLLNYGSMEFIGPYVGLLSDAALALTALAFGWLLLWRLRAERWTAATPADAALTAVLLSTTTSRVISPQYMIWLVGLAAVCMTLRASRQRRVAWLVLAATGVTQLEFPLGFAHVVASDWQGLLLMSVRNGLLVAASLLACRRLWRSARPAGDVADPAGRAARPGAGPDTAPPPSSGAHPEPDGAEGTEGADGTEGTDGAGSADGTGSADERKGTEGAGPADGADTAVTPPAPARTNATAP